MNKIMQNSVEDRFSAKFVPEPNSGCWLWIGAVTYDGYGRFNVAGKNMLASRVSYELYVGKIPSGLCVCHTCDVTCCVNPGHLFLGTRADNNIDMQKKGRSADARGEKNGRSKITSEQALEILHSTLRPFELSRIYGVTLSNICHIKKGRSWI